jgi:hypothetical protein
MDIAGGGESLTETNVAGRCDCVGYDHGYDR